MPGKFIISLDCEGKWGMADCLTDRHRQHLTHASLLEVYGYLTRTLRGRDMPATFAFVMAFILDEHERRTLEASFHPPSVRIRSWLYPYMERNNTRQPDGWHCPEALEMVRENADFEIGSHGFCHVPFANPPLSLTEAQWEFDQMTAAANLKLLQPKTFVYPRNFPAHVDLLSEHNYLAYRAEPRNRDGSESSLLRMLINEFRFNERSEQPIGPELPNGVIVIPAGFILNFPQGGRKLVPPSVTRMRWRAALQHAVEHDGVVLLWFHPHNLITSPKARSMFEFILDLAADAREKHGLECVTQQRFCESVHTL